MDTLKLICLTVAGLIKQVLYLPHTIVLAVQNRRQRVVRKGLEVERLDRIRNPSKYLGKG
jgi:hypothetical protein